MSVQYNSFVSFTCKRNLSRTETETEYKKIKMMRKDLADLRAKQKKFEESSFWTKAKMYGLVILSKGKLKTPQQRINKLEKEIMEKYEDQIKKGYLII